MKLVTVAEMQAIEREADASGWTFSQMMERAGSGLADIVEAFYGYEDHRIVTALVGSGNNGGDTLIALEHLASSGWQTRAFLVKPRSVRDQLSLRASRAGVQIIVADSDPNFEQLNSWLSDSSLLLDGVLGTGIRLPLQPEVARVLAHVRDFRSLPSVVAVDCPSGVDLNTGQVADETFPAEVTVCMAAVKLGLLRYPAARYSGSLQVVDIGLPHDLPSWKMIGAEILTDDLVTSLLPIRSPDSHKGTFGTVEIVAGSLSFTGAALLCAGGAARIGAGLVQIAAPAPLHSALAGHIPEATWVLLPHENGAVAEAAVEPVLQSLSRVSVLLVGPGFGVAGPTEAFMQKLFRQSRAQHVAAPLPPMVLDADGLKLLARLENWSDLLPEGSILTPHPGEMSILCGLPIQEIQSNRLEVARRFAKQWRQVVVLKGAITVVAEPGGRARVIPIASSALAHAGTGDVLAGMIAGLRSQGVSPFDAASAAAWIHAQTGLQAAEVLGHPASVLAGDLIKMLPRVLSWVWPD